MDGDIRRLFFAEKRTGMTMELICYKFIANPIFGRDRFLIISAATGLSVVPTPLLAELGQPLFYWRGDFTGRYMYFFEARPIKKVIERHGYCIWEPKGPGQGGYCARRRTKQVQDDC